MLQAAVKVDGSRTGEEQIGSTFMIRIFLAFAGLAALALVVSFGGKRLGAELALAGYTDDHTAREIVVGNNVVSVPSNMIRFERARRDGVANRLDLYLRWPSLDGYSAQARDDFNNADGGRKILFLAFEPKMMSRDMSGRFEPIYKSLIVTPGHAAEGGVTVYDFTPQSGYLNEVLAVALRDGLDPFVARCLSGQSAAESLAPCERDIQIGDRLSMTYRFPRHLLGDWKKLDAAVSAKAVAMLRTAR